MAFIVLFFLSSILPAQNLSVDKNELYIVDTTQSSISWNCGQHFGCILIDTGYVEVINNDPVGGKFFIDLNSLYVEDIEHELLRLTLANVIKSHEFFDAGHYPNIVFLIEKLIEIDDNFYNVAGQLTIKNMTLPVNFNCEINIEDDSISVYSEYFGIDRTEWGINYLSKKFDPEEKEQMHVPDIIEFLIHLKAKKIKKKKEK